MATRVVVAAATATATATAAVVASIVAMARRVGVERKAEGVMVAGGRAEGVMAVVMVMGAAIMATSAVMVAKWARAGLWAEREGTAVAAAAVG